MNDIENIDDLFSMGAVVALSLFSIFAFMLMLSADSPSEATDIFARSFAVLVLAAYPTTRLCTFK